MRPFPFIGIFLFFFLQTFFLQASDDYKNINPNEHIASIEMSSIEPLSKGLIEIQFYINTTRKDAKIYFDTLKWSSSKANLVKFSTEDKVLTNDPASDNKTWLLKPKALVTAIIKTKAIGPLNFSLEYQSCVGRLCLLPKTLASNVVLPFRAITLMDWLVELILAFFAGLLISLTPCILPIIPITLKVLHHQKNMPFLKKSLYTGLYILGVCLSFSALGALFGLSGQLFGSALSSPFVLLTLGVLFILFGLAMLLPKGLSFNTERFSGFLPKLTSVDSPLKSFLYGVLSSLVLGPCVTPVVLGALTYVSTTQSFFIGWLILFFFALGSCSFIVLLSFSSHLVDKVKVLNRFTPYFQKILGVILIMSSLYFFYPFLEDKLFITKSTSVMDWDSYSNPAQFNKFKDKNKVIYFTTSWCLECQNMKRNLWNQKDFEPYKDKFHWIKVDVTSTSVEEKKLLKKYKVLGIPTLIVLSSDQNSTSRFSGGGISGSFLFYMKNFDKDKPFTK